MRSDENVTILIHFGGQGREACAQATQVMNEAAQSDSNLQKYKFIAVSQHNRFPEEFFNSDGVLTFPEDNVLNEVVAGNTPMPAYDHLRGIVLLCQALLQVKDEAKRKRYTENISWWQQNLWDTGAEHIFSAGENKILENSELLKNFCTAIAEYSAELKLPDDIGKLDEIVKEITRNLR